MDLKLSEHSLKIDFVNREHAVRFDALTSVNIKYYGSDTWRRIVYQNFPMFRPNLLFYWTLSQ
jgi:hypothetical protein